MKPLQALYSQIGIHLNAKYYAPYLDKKETAVIDQAVKKKQPPLYQLNLLRLLALKIITELQRSASFCGETRWQTTFTEIASALLVNHADWREMGNVLHQADDLIEAAWTIRAVRKDILATVQERSILSASEEQQYEAIRQACLTQNAALTELDEQVYQLKNKLLQTSGHQPVVLPVWKVARRELPSHVLNYRVGASKIHLSEENIRRLIRAEKDARSVYQDLASRLMKKPTVESIGEEIQTTKIFLKDKAKTILDNANQLQRTILDNAQRAIEHRSQAKLAHARKIESLLVDLEKIIRLLESYQLQYKPNSLLLLTEAKTMRALLDDSSQAVESTILQQKLFNLESQRKIFQQSITSTWSAFFSSRQTARRQYEQKLNTDLQSTIARLVIPLSSFNDHATIATPAQIKQQHQTVRQLDEKQDRVVLERMKIEKIKNSFVK